MLETETIYLGRWCFKEVRGHTGDSIPYLSVQHQGCNRRVTLGLTMWHLLWEEFACGTCETPIPILYQVPFSKWINERFDKLIEEEVKVRL